MQVAIKYICFLHEENKTDFVSGENTSNNEIQLGDLFEDFMRELEKENYESNGRARKKGRRMRGAWIEKSCLNVSLFKSRFITMCSSLPIDIYNVAYSQNECYLKEPVYVFRKLI